MRPAGRRAIIGDSGRTPPRATRCPRRGQRQGRKISPRSQRRDDQKPEQAKRARPGEARHAVDRLARMSGVGRREADAARGDIPLVEQSMPFLASKRPVEPRKGEETEQRTEVRGKRLRRLDRREKGGRKGEGRRGDSPPLPPPFYTKRGTIF